MPRSIAKSFSGTEISSELEGSTAKDTLLFYDLMFKIFDLLLLLLIIKYIEESLPSELAAQLKRTNVGTVRTEVLDIHGR